MSETSQLVFYSPRASSDIRVALSLLFDDIHHEGTVSVSRKSFPLAQHASADKTCGSLLGAYDIFDRSVMPTEVATLASPDSLLKIDLFGGKNRLSRGICQSILDEIPEIIRGDFSLTEMNISLGPGGFYPHNDECEHPIKTMVDISFWGYSAPSNKQRFTERLFDLTMVANMKHSLERAFGDLELIFVTSE